MFYLNTCSVQKLMFIHAWLYFCNRTTKEMVTFGIIYFMLLLSCDAEKCISSCDAEKFIYVSKNGSLNESCWDGGQAMPCATLDLAFDGAKRQNSTTVVIENGSFSLNHSHTFQDLHVGIRTLCGRFVWQNRYYFQASILQQNRVKFLSIT